MTTPLVKYFEIGPVVTVLHSDGDRIFCPLAQLNDILAFMTGDTPTHEANDIDGVDSIAEAIERCRPHIAALYPGLAAEQPLDWDDPTDRVTEGEIITWLVTLGVKYAAPLAITQLPDITRSAAEPPAPADPEGTPA